jgi:hypothetical protein
VTVRSPFDLGAASGALRALLRATWPAARGELGEAVASSPPSPSASGHATHAAHLHTAVWREPGSSPRSARVLELLKPACQERGVLADIAGTSGATTQGDQRWGRIVPRNQACVKRRARGNVVEVEDGEAVTAGRSWPGQDGGNLIAKVDGREPGGRSHRHRPRKSNRASTRSRDGPSAGNRGHARERRRMIPREPRIRIRCWRSWVSRRCAVPHRPDPRSLRSRAWPSTTSTSSAACGVAHRVLSLIARRKTPDGKCVDRIELETVNERSHLRDLEPADCRARVLGITKAR